MSPLGFAILRFRISVALGGNMPGYSSENPLGLLGLDFVEFTSQNSAEIEFQFSRLGFAQSGNFFHQGRIRHFLNTESHHAKRFAENHGSSIVGLGFVFANAGQAHKLALQRGCKPFEGKGLFAVPAVYGLGDSIIYFLDQISLESIYGANAGHLGSPRHLGQGLEQIDHMTWNVGVGEMEKWCQYLKTIFGFRETRFFDIQGLKTGLISKVMRSPCSTFAIPVNEPTDPRSQIQEYLNEYKGPGIQHIAYLTKNIIKSVVGLRSQGVEFLTPPPATYYKLVKDRVPFVAEPTCELQTNAILVDGDQVGYLLQIFTKNIFGPIFFEVIQRAGHDGFGEGNFQTLFDAIERDQFERGVL